MQPDFALSTAAPAPAAEISRNAIRSTSRSSAVKIEDRPLADPHLPKVARVALVVFCLAMVGAFAWAVALIGWGMLHRLPWHGILLLFGYLGWTIWSDRRKETKRRRKAEARSKDTPI